jgi:hypothetical protein
MLLRCALHLGPTDILEQLLEKSNIDIESIRAVFRTGEAHALLESDLREKSRCSYQAAQLSCRMKPGRSFTAMSVTA